MSGARRLVVSVVALSAVACGNKTPVRPPELIQPRPPTALVARSTPAGVALTWSRPGEYTGGGRMNDLGGFEIERAPGDAPGGFERIGTLTVDDQMRFRPQRTLEWTDASAVPKTRYAYRVIAFTLDDYRSAPAGPVTVLFDPSKVDPSRPGQ